MKVKKLIYSEKQQKKQIKIIKKEKKNKFVTLFHNCYIYHQNYEENSKISDDITEVKGKIKNNKKNYIRVFGEEFVKKNIKYF